MSMTRKRWMAVGAGVVGLLLAGGGVGVYVVTRPIAFDEPPLPVPNGYDDLLEAAKQIRGPVPDLQKASPEELQVFVERNPDVLERARVGLERECRVPLVNSPAYMQAAIHRSQAMRRLAHLFLAEGRAAESAGDLSRAATSYRDTVVLGSQIARGGLLVDVITGFACEGLGLREPRRLVPTLPKDTCRELKAVLAEIETGREPWENIGRREQILFHNTSPVGVRVSMSVSPAWRKLHSFDHWDTSWMRADARLRLLQTRLALRMYWLDHGEYPEQLSELVPDYLVDVPLDPFGGGPLVYDLTEDRYDLSSTGYNEEEDKIRPSAE